jgi:hypothetical protein
MGIVAKRFRSCRSLWHRLIVVAALASVGVLPLIEVSRGSKKAPGPVAITRADPAIQSRLAPSYGKLPLSFERNAGQTDASVRFLSRGPGYSLFLTGNDALLSIEKRSHPQIKAPVDLRLGAALFPGLASIFFRPQKPNHVVQRENPTQAPASFRMSLAGANQNATVTGLDELPGKSNYFIGNDPAKWRTNVPTYAKVKYQNVYRGIDLVYYGNPQQLEYDFLVAPGADPNAISLDVAAIRSSSDGGWRTLRIDANGDLVIQAGEDEVRLHKPVVYQATEGSARHFVDGHYVLRGDNQVSFGVASYDPGKTLVIDPVLLYSTYLGGAGNDQGNGIAVDAAGNAYITGDTESTNFPTASPLQAVFGGVQDVFVAKLNPAGTALVYSTYLGGSGGDGAEGIAVDSSGNAYVAGTTTSTNFPTAHPLQAVLHGGQDAFVAKLNPAGAALVYSTYLGGNSYDLGQGIAVDSSGNAYVTGYTVSTDFPTVSPIQGVFGGYIDAFVAKLNPGGSALVYSTYLGGGGEDEGYGITADSSGNAYVTGSTRSTNFPTASPIQAVLRGSGDAFVAKVNPAGSALVYSTYLGGSSGGGGTGIAVDASGNAYVTGSTYSTDFPTANPLQAVSGGGDDAFVAKVNPAGSALVYSTYLGGSADDVGQGIAVDSTGNAYVTGYTTSTNFPTASPPQAVYGGGNYDAFVAKLNPSGSALVYSTYLGGNNEDFGYGVAVDSAGNAYVTGFTGSTNFPTANPLQALFGGPFEFGSDAFVTKIGGVSPPSCQLMSIVNGPPKQLIVTMQDAASGLQSIQLAAAVNTILSIPSFAIGATTPVIVTATKVNQSQGSEVSFIVTNTAGKTTSCDPVDFTAQIENRMETHVFRSLSNAEHYVRIVNGTPGLRRIAFRVNGTLLPESHLADGETTVLDIGPAMQQGSNNIVLMHASGKAGASAYILIGDSSVN